MDSLTQALLGAATFGIVKHKSIGKAALLIGAVVGTLPDLDVLLNPLFNDVASLSVHRSFSHSIGLAVLLSVGLGFCLHHFYKKKYNLWRWMFAIFLSLITHTLLDCCTTYGTKLFSPFNGFMFSTNNIHVIEPVYTFILLAGVLLFLLLRLKYIKRFVLGFTLLLSTLYLGWTFVSKNIAAQQFIEQLEQQSIPYNKLMVTPTPLNSVLWHCIAKVDNGYYFATYCLLDKRCEIDFQFEESASEVMEFIPQNKLLNYYLAYTQDFPLIKRDKNDNIKIYAIKFGPVNYFGKPEFVYPLCFNLNDVSDESITIDYSGKQRGPVKNYKKLFKRIKGI